MYDVTLISVLFRYNWAYVKNQFKS